MKMMVDALRMRSNISSVRFTKKVMQEVCATLPQNLRVLAESRTLCDQWTEEVEYSFPSLLITPAVGERQGGGGQLLSFATPRPDTFKDAGKKALYHLCVKVLKLHSLTELRNRGGLSFLAQTLLRKAAGGPWTSWQATWKGAAR